MTRLVRLAVPLVALVLGAASGTAQPPQQRQAPQQPPSGSSPEWGQGSGNTQSQGGGGLGSLQGNFGGGGGGGQPGFGSGGNGGGAGQVSDPAWDMALNVPSNKAEVENKADQLTIKYTDDRGALSVSVLRNPNLTDLRALADNVRNDSKTSGDRVSDIAEQTFMGHTGFQWITANDQDYFTLVLMSHQAPCVYFLVATTKGSQEEMLEYFKWTTSIVGTVSGGPANGPNCR